MKLHLYLTPYTKINSKTYIRPETMKFLEENLQDIGFGNDFFDRTPKV